MERGLIILVLCTCFKLIASTCDKSMDGYTNCMRSSWSDEYQWAVCLSNKRIQELTNGAHFCRDRFAEYCWYPCTLLITSKRTVKVDKICKCDRQRITFQKSALDLNCYVPKTATCDWYSRCTTSSKCSKDLATEVSEMEHLCNTFKGMQDHLSSSGKTYTHAVQKCLRIPLHTLLYPESDVQCKHLKSAFYSRLSDCFTQPEKMASVQNLSSSDQLLLYFNSLASKSSDDFEPVVSEYKNIVFKADMEPMRNKVFRVEITFKQTSQQNVDTSAEELTKYMLSQSGLQENIVVWASRGNLHAYHSSAEMLVCSKKNCVFEGHNYANVDILSAISTFGNSIQNRGTHTVSTSLGDIELLTLKICSDRECLSAHLNVDTGGNSACSALDGVCQDDSNHCSGSYVSNKCKSEPANVRCCTKEIYDKDPGCTNIGGTCKRYQMNSNYCGGNENGYTSNLCSVSNEKCCAPCQCTKKAKELACEIKQLYEKGNITLENAHQSGITDLAFAKTNIFDTCLDKRASRSSYSKTCPAGCDGPGGSICLSERVLKYIYDLATTTKYGPLLINEIAGGCHGCNSRHYRGLAVDLDISKTITDARNNQAKEYMDLCRDMQGWAKDETSHVHCQFYICNI